MTAADVHFVIVFLIFRANNIISSSSAVLAQTNRPSADRANTKSFDLKKYPPRPNVSGHEYAYIHKLSHVVIHYGYISAAILPAILKILILNYNKLWKKENNNNVERSIHTITLSVFYVAAILGNQFMLLFIPWRMERNVMGYSDIFIHT